MDTGPHSAPRDDQAEPQEYTPQEAAVLLGVSKRQVLNYLNSGELAGIQDAETGRWSIPPAHVEDLRRRREQEQRKKPPKPEQGTPHAADREMVEMLREQVEDLRARLDTADQRDREQRRIIAALTSRIPELPPASQPENIAEWSSDERERREQAGMTQTPTDAPAGPQTGSQSPQAEEKRPWWRRIFGP